MNRPGLRLFDRYGWTPAGAFRPVSAIADRSGLDRAAGLWCSRRRTIVAGILRAAIVAIVAAPLIAGAVSAFISPVTPLCTPFRVPVAISGMVTAVIGPLSGPMAPVMVAHRVAMAAAVEDINPIAGIIILIVPAAAETDIGKAIAIVAGIIIIERGIGIAVIAAVVDIAVAIIAGTPVHTAAQAQ